MTAENVWTLCESTAKVLAKIYKKQMFTCPLSWLHSNGRSYSKNDVIKEIEYNISGAKSKEDIAILINWVKTLNATPWESASQEEDFDGKYLCILTRFLFTCEIK